MNFSEWLELAARKVKEYLEAGGQTVDLNQSNVLWGGSVLEIRRAVVWYGDKLYMVQYNTNTTETTIDTYVRQTGEDEDL